MTHWCGHSPKAPSSLRSSGTAAIAPQARGVVRRQIAARGRSPSSDPAQACGLGLICVEGKPPGKLTEQLWERHILVTGIVHKDFQGLRITPNIYTTLEEIDIFCTEMEKLILA